MFWKALLATADEMKALLERIRSADLRNIGRAILVCWVSLTSLMIGLFLFGSTLQGPDLFLEIHSSGFSGLWHWSVFYTALIVVWLLPTYVCTKMTLLVYDQNAHNNNMIEPSTVRRLPICLSIGTILLVLLGQSRALSHIIESSLEFVYSEELLVDSTTHNFVFLLPPAFVLMGVGIGLIGCRRFRIGAVISAIGILCVAATVAIIQLTSAPEVLRILTSDGGDYSAILYVPLLMVTSSFLPIAWIVLNGWQHNPDLLRKLFAATVVFSIALILLFSIVDPLLASKYIQRAQILPIILGVWIAPLTYLRLISIRRRIPAVLILLLLFGTIPILFGDGHDLRRHPVATFDYYERPSLEQSLDQWALANDCKIGSKVPEKKCPPPIIVASAGGASRAAFHYSSVVGELMDRTENAAVPDRQKFSKRLFAVSGISGGATGAAFHRAALAKAHFDINGQTDLVSPCVATILLDDELYMGAHSFGSARTRRLAVDEPLEENIPVNWESSWRACLEALSSGDFLTPTILSTVFSDFLPLNLFSGDRAEILERSWESRFKKLTEADLMSAGFLGMRNLVMESQPNAWLPHMVFGATSERSGRRVLISDFGQFYCFKQTQNDFTASYATGGGIDGRRTCVKLFRDIQDIYFHFDEDDAPDEEDLLAKFYARKSCVDCELRLSTAASASARFPLVSPHANIRNANGVIVDRIVDGGYFENYGALAALEMSEAIVRIARSKGDSTLVPMVILLKNDPSSGSNECTTTGTESSGTEDFEPVGQFAAFSLLSTPLATFMATRNARGAHAATQLCVRLAEMWREASPKETVDPVGQHVFNLRLLGDFYVEFDVAFANRPFDGLSMSWWLSKHTQDAIDGVIRTGSFSRGNPIDTVLRVLNPGQAAIAAADERQFED